MDPVWWVLTTVSKATCWEADVLFYFFAGDRGVRHHGELLHLRVRVAAVHLDGLLSGHLRLGLQIDCTTGTANWVNENIPFMGPNVITHMVSVLFGVLLFGFRAELFSGEVWEGVVTFLLFPLLPLSEAVFPV